MMIKNIFCIVLALISACSLFGQDTTVSSIYRLDFPALNTESSSINMNNYEGKKIIVVESDAGNPDRELLLSLDTLYQNNPDKLVIIAVPVRDFGDSTTPGNILKLWKDTLNLNYVIAFPGLAKKINGSAQHPLMQWVSNDSLNKHFNRDIEKSGEMFIISEHGRLYALLKTSIPVNGTVMNNILSMTIPDEQ